MIINRLGNWKLWIISLALLVIFYPDVSANERSNQADPDLKRVKISMTLKSSTLKESFDEIEKRSDLNFVYDQRILADIAINASFENASIFDILLEIGRQSNLSFRQVNSNINVQERSRANSPNVPVVVEENRVVFGRVFDENGESMVGVTVQVKGTQNGGLTDLDGNYRISLNTDNAILIFSFIGYTKIEITVGVQKKIDVTMEVNYEELNAVVVVGYGSQIKRNISSSITSVDVDKLNSATVNSFEGGLQGIAAGVQVTSSSALAGSAIRVRIRGTSSASANSEPLYVIDGVPVESGEISTSQPGGSIAEYNLQQAANTNVLASLNPADIKSIEILKDAASAAIYGSRGANGVVLITTKNGIAGATKVTASASFGLSDATHRIPLLNSSQYIALAQKAWYNSGNSLENFWANSGVLVDGLTKEEAMNTDTDWIDEVLQIGKVQDYNISVSGGSEKTTFYVSAGLKEQQTILKGNDYFRLGTRLNLDHKIGENVKIGGKMMLTVIDNKQVPTNWAGGISNVSEMLPIWPVRKEDGSFFNLTDEHPVAGVELRQIHLKSTQILANWYLDYTIIKGLTFRTEFGSNLLFNDDFHYRDGRITSHGRTVASTVSGVRTSWNWKNILNYKETFGDHTIDILGATDVQSFSTRTNFVFGDTFINSTLSRPQDAAIINASVSESEYAFQSFLSRLNYGFKEKYILSMSLRADGSSRFGKENRWGYFPAVSVAWIISDEELFRPFRDKINFLKLRTSYGIVGNAEIGDYSAASIYQTSTYNGNTGISIGNLGDENLGWESTSQLNIGITWEIFNGRISGEFDYYSKSTKNLLLPYPVSQMIGVSAVTRNIGELQNEGVDVMVNTLNIAKKNFTWETNVTLNHNKNMVVKLGDEVISNGLSTSSGLSSTSIFPGYPVGVQEGVIWGGVDAETGEDTYFDRAGNLYLFSEVVKQFGSFDAFVNSENQPIGNPWPNLTGGIDNRFTYKKFYGSVLFTFATGQDFADGYMKQLNAPFGGEKVNPSTYALNSWNNSGDNVTVSKLTTENVRWPNTTEFLHRTDYLRLRDLTIGYNSGNKGKKLKNVNIYVKFTNILTFTKAPDFYWDPEFTGVVQSRSSNNLGAGGAFKQSPQAQSVLFGMTIEI